MKIVQRDKDLYIMSLIGLAWIFVFNYIPLYGIMVAFKRYDPVLGIWGSPWVGLRYFKLFIESPFFLRLLRNTFLLSGLSILFGFWPPVLLALLFNEIKNMKFKKLTQTISYLPHFIATVIIVGMLKEFFSYNGLVNQMRSLLGASSSISFFNQPSWFRPLYIGSGIWQGVGFGSIIYLATLSGINPEMYEAAIVEGANRFHRMIYITIPSLLPTISILVLLSLQGILSVGFEKVYLMYSPATYETADVMSTYIYRMGLEQAQFSQGAAIGLLNQAASFIILVIVNNVARKLSGWSLW